MKLEPDMRALDRTHFVAAAGWPKDAIRPLAADASTRAYYRLETDKGRAVLMDAPPAAEAAACPADADAAQRRALGYNAMARLAGPDSRPFAAVASWLTGKGLSAPRIINADFERGLMLLEDLGDALFARIIGAGQDPWPLYEAAVDALAALHGHPAPERLALQNGTSLPLLSYDRLALETETVIMIDWYLRAAQGGAVEQAVYEESARAWADVLPRLETPQPVMVLRDYHAENLLWLPERAGVARVGLLDFQDALAGHGAYDLVSLLTDARRDVEPDLAEAMLERYMTARMSADPAFDRNAFLSAYAILNVQRNTKILGIFARLWLRDGKPGYLKHIPRVWRYLEAGLTHADLAPVRAWFDTHVPDALRGGILEEHFHRTQPRAQAH